MAMISERFIMFFLYKKRDGNKKGGVKPPPFSN